MKKSEIFSILLDKVAEVCEVNRDDIMTGKKLQAVFDARLIMVQYLRRVGLSSDDIAFVVMKLKGQEPDLNIIKKKAKTIDRLFNSYSQRCLESYSFCLMSADISKFCREQYEALSFEPHMKQLPRK